MSVREMLIAARARIATPNTWTTGKGVAARDASGKKCDPMDPAAVAWCGYGAVIAGNPSNEALAACGRYLDKASPTGHFPYWQDTVSHPTMLAVFDRAIASVAE